MGKILKLHQANEDGATDINTQFTPVTIDGDFMSWVPKDIKTNEEFNTGRTIDGKPIYGIYVKNTSISLTDKSIIYATTCNYRYIDPHHRESNANFLYTISQYLGQVRIDEFKLPIDGGNITSSDKAENLNKFLGFIFYTKI